MTDKWFTESWTEHSAILTAFYPLEKSSSELLLFQHELYKKEFVLIDLPSNGDEEDVITYLHVVS